MTTDGVEVQNKDRSLSGHGGLQTSLSRAVKKE